MGAEECLSCHSRGSLNGNPESKQTGFPIGVGNDGYIEYLFYGNDDRVREKHILNIVKVNYGKKTR